MSLDKFLIADNPMREHGTQAIIHTQHPISIILVDEGHIRTKWPHRHYTHHSPLPELFTLSVYHCMVHTFDGEEQNLLLEKLFKNAWHWYVAYMTWEDAQTNF